MEKFGIFDLLDALSAAAAPPAPAGENAPAPSSEEGPAAKTTPDTHDGAFAAPTYGAAAPSPAEPASPPAESAPQQDGKQSGEAAYNAFLARHQEAVGRIDKKR